MDEKKNALFSYVGGIGIGIGFNRLWMRDFPNGASKTDTRLTKRYHIRLVRTQ